MAIVVIAVTLLALAQLHGQLMAAPDSKSVGTTVLIRGRVLAAIDSPFHGAGLGPKYESFILGWQQTKGQVRPIKILYAYFNQHKLPANFFDYTTRYELAAVREARCDETVNSLSLIKNVDSSGRELPPTNALHPLESAPVGLLKPETNLPCYVVHEGRFKSLPSDK